MTEVDDITMLAEGIYKKFFDTLGPYLDRVGIDRSVVSDPKAQVPLAKHAELMEVVARETGDDCLGLHIGMKVVPADLGVIGFAMNNSVTVRAALENFSRYLGAYTGGCFFELIEKRDETYYDFGYTLPELGILDRRQEAECTLALVLNIVRIISGERVNPVRVSFEHPAPKTVSEYNKVFDSPVEFGRPKNTIVFKTNFLDQPVKSADSRLFDVVEEHLQLVISEQVARDDSVAQVRKVIARQLSNGVPTIDWVASQMGLAKRTLQRRLNDEGMRFSQIVDEVRHSMAVRYVEKSDMALTEVAFLLGYSHLSAFSR
ncbi:AraC family transcriptional regulator, partial [Myxococcota bacterium]|nr:AraC family transcriptional regulator [Myxococcota bacterium]